MDITDPRQSQRVGLYDCGVTQGDVQIFRQASKPGRVFATYTSDTYGDGTFGNDMARGMDIYLFDGAGARPRSRGRWMSAQEASVELAGRPTPGVAGTTYVCLVDL